MIIHGDSLEVLKTLDENSVDAVVTDPPWAIKFMQRKWDYDIPSIELWREVIRVLKPGSHALICCGTRTQHRMVVNVEDAGFEIRDVVTHLYGSGFPKSHNLPGGLGTALKPACEFWTLARKPLSEKTVAANVLKWGCGALNIDASRITTTDNLNGGAYSGENRASKNGDILKIKGEVGEFVQPQGRWPANLLLDEEAAAALGEPSRFFYCAKSSKAERNRGMGEGTNGHPTIKPIRLMEYLIRLVTPPGGIVLDPFMGSGSTGVAAKNLGFKFIGIEMNEEYVAIAKKRINEPAQTA